MIGEFENIQFVNKVFVIFIYYSTRFFTWTLFCITNFNKYNFVAKFRIP